MSYLRKILLQKGVITSGLIGWWKFDEGSGSVATDSSSSKKNGTLVNSPSWIAGKVGAYALNFAHISQQYVSTSLNSALNDFTICAWFLDNDSNPASSTLRIVDKTYNTGFWLGKQTTSVAGNNFYGGGIRQSSAPFGIFVNVPSAASSWTHIAMSRNSATQTIYINGISSASQVNDNVTLSSSSLDNLAIGVDTGLDVSVCWDGQIDDVRLYNRALTDNEIAAIANLRG